jgi:hypothetical protein
LCIICVIDSKQGSIPTVLLCRFCRRTPQQILPALTANFEERHMPRHSLLTLLSVVLLCGLLTPLGFALNYQYFVDEDQGIFGDHGGFATSDTLTGPVRTNGCFRYMDGWGTPYFDLIIMSASYFCPDSNFHVPEHPPIITNAPLLVLPTEALWIRQQAHAQGHFYVGDDSLLARVSLEDHNLRVRWLRRFPPADTLLIADYPLADSAVVFFDFPEVYLSGTVNSVLILGASGRIGLEDNVLYASSDLITGAVIAGHSEKLAVIAEGEIKILNTVANGRENSGGRGLNQTDPDSTSIALNGIFAALGESFTFEQQNDPDSGYVCECQPDRRGALHLIGSLLQKRRGYTFRATQGGTGYKRHFRYDPDLKYWNVPLFDARENELDRTALDFGSVALGDTIRDTLTIYNDYVPLKLDTLLTDVPFAATTPATTYTWHPRIAVSFAPTAPGNFETELHIPLVYYNTELTVTLRGTCITSGTTPRTVLPRAFTLSASPNPFNAQTRLSFTVPRAGFVSLKVYDTLGRECAVLLQTMREAGTHQSLWNASALPAGIYFVHLTTATDETTTKVLLLK